MKTKFSFTEFVFEKLLFFWGNCTCTFFPQLLLRCQSSTALYVNIIPEETRYLITCGASNSSTIALLR